MHKMIGKKICKVCDKSFVTEATLNAHRKIHKIPQFIGSMDSETNDSLATDIDMCPLCSFTFDNIYDLQFHLREHRDNRYITEYQHICEFCNQRFKESYHLGLHIDLVHLRFTCQICNQRFLNKYVLQQHIRQNHSNYPIKLIGN